MAAEGEKFPPDWKKIPGEKVEYRKKVGAFEMRALETLGFCEKCGKKGRGFSFRTVDGRGEYLGRSGAYWCPTCGEGMSPTGYEGFVRNELITPEM